MALIPNTAMSMVGAVKKAYLVIHKGSDSQEINTTKLAAQTDAILAASTAAAATGVGAAASKAGAAFSGYVMEVQYNPPSLSIYASAQSIAFSGLPQNIDTGIPTHNVAPPSIKLSVELIFDAMNIPDAFMAEKLNLTAGNIISDVAAARKSAQGGYTVQPQTNGLLAMLLRSGTRLVTFRWGDMAFTGIVSEAQAEYTMFSVSGHPIRSKVRMNISQQVESNGDYSYWSDAYNKLCTNADSAGKSAVQKAGNLLNLSVF